VLVVEGLIQCKSMFCLVVVVLRKSNLKEYIIIYIHSARPSPSPWLTLETGSYSSPSTVDRPDRPSTLRHAGQFHTWASQLQWARDVVYARVKLVCFMGTES
jgi:hypothetical protein